MPPCLVREHWGKKGRVRAEGTCVPGLGLGDLLALELGVAQLGWELFTVMQVVLGKKN